MATIQAPNGVKVRCESNRRYWVVEYWGENRPHEVGGPDIGAQVVFRTDNHQKAFARQYARRYEGTRLDVRAWDSHAHMWLSL